MKYNSLDYKGFPFKKDFDIFDDTLQSETVYPINNQEISVSKNGFIYDFEKEYVGYPAFYLKGKGKILITYGERLFETELDNWKEDRSNMPYDYLDVDSEEYYKCEIGKRRALRYIKIALIEGYASVREIEFESVHAKIETEGYFKCSDEQLNDIYEICKRTTLLCMQDYFEDGVKRDGLCWIGDSRVEFLCDYNMFGNTELIKKSIKYFCRSIDKKGRVNVNGTPGGAYIQPDKIEYLYGMKSDDGNHKKCSEILYKSGLGYYLNYCADFISIIDEYYEHTFDIDFVKEVYPYYKKVVNRVCCVDKDKVYGNIFEQIVRSIRKQIWKIKGENLENLHGKLFPRQRGKSRSYVDNFCDSGSYFCLLVDSLKKYLHICRVLGDSEEVNKVNGYIEKFTVLAKKYINDEGFVIRKVKGDKIRIPTCLGLSFGFLAEIIGKEKFEHCFKKIINNETPYCYPQSGLAKYWSVKAAFKNGQYEDVINYIKKEWGVLLKSGYTTCVERWDCENVNDFEQDPNASCCHGWSAGAGIYLTDLLGVKMLSRNTVSIKPHLCGLDYIEGAIPSPFGLIKVYVDKNGVKYDVPKEIKVV